MSLPCPALTFLWGGPINSLMRAVKMLDGAFSTHFQQWSPLRITRKVLVNIRSKLALKGVWACVWMTRLESLATLATTKTNDESLRWFQHALAPLSQTLPRHGSGVSMGSHLKVKTQRIDKALFVLQILQLTFSCCLCWLWFCWVWIY